MSQGTLNCVTSPNISPTLLMEMCTALHVLWLMHQKCNECLHHINWKCSLCPPATDHNHLNNAALSPLGPAMALSHPHNNLGIGFNKYTSLKAVGK